MSQVLGRATVRVDGKVYETLPGARLKLGGVKRNPRANNQAVHYSEQFEPSELECEILLARGDSLAEILAIADATIEFECDTGQTYIVRGGFLTDTPEITDGEDGRVPLKFSGNPAEEVL